MERFEDLVAAIKAHMERRQDGYTPLYHRIQRAIRDAIAEGELGEDDVLPPERDLAQALGVSRVTVRNAIRSLVADGLLVQRQGAGTFVSRRIEMALTVPTSFSEDMKARGMAPEYKLLDRHTGPAMPIEIGMLKLKPGTLVTRLYRVRYGNKKPMCLELACVPAEALPADVEIGTSLYSHFDTRNLRPVRALQKLRSELLDTEQARLLGVPPGSAALFVEQQSFLANGQPIEYVRSFYRGDSYEFVAELKM